MKNRSLYAVLTRFGIIGAVLTAVLLIGSVASAQGVNSDAHEYAENTDITVPIGTYSAVDPEGEGVEYGVSNDDDFEISEEGVLSFKESPDFEDMPSYMVNVTANDAVLVEVTITILNVQEPGTVTLDQPQPEVGVSVEADVEDDDVVPDTVTWQWARSSDMVTWEDIEDEESEDYTPVAADVGMYLRATATYDDAAEPDDDPATKDMNEGLVSTPEDTGISERTVRGSPPANARPMFPDEEVPAGADPIEINISENATGAIGDRVIASDADNDVRLYSLTEADPRTVADEEDANARFEINVRTGQISVTSGTVLNASTDTAIDDGNNEASYVVTVTATDPSGASDMVMVTINVGNVDEAPTGLDADANPTKLTIDENGRELSAPADSDLTYTAADPDGGGVTVVWDLSGADAASFEINTSGQLSYNDETDDTQDDFVAPPDHEAKAEYSITIEVKGGAESDIKSTLDVTVTVDDVAEDGTVTLSARQSHVGKSVTAELDEDDDNATGIQWRWTTVASDGGCANADFGDIAPSSSYTPVLADDEQYLCAQASYFDDAEPADAETRDTSVGESEAVIEVRPPFNSAPKFPDGDDEGTDADPVMIEIEENDEGIIGDPVTAEDSDSDPVQDLLLYSIGGPDGASFTIEERDTNSAGQISVAEGVTLDFENPSDVGGTPGDNEYVVMVIATDPSGAVDTVEVTITVTNVEEDPMAPEGVTNPAEVDYAENDTVDVGTYSAVDPEGDDIMWDVGGADASSFSISDEGVLTFNDPPDFETQDSYSVDVKANDAVLVPVTVTILNVQEPGTVELDQPQPEVGQAVVAKVEDDDFGPDDSARPATVMWQWARSLDMVTWEDIEDEESEDYTPVAADVGMYLRATATYDDAAEPDDDPATKDMNEGLVSTPEDTGISERTVRGSPPANARPMFPDEEVPAGADPIEINISENATGAIGDRVTASDADNDVRLYSLTEADPRTVADDEEANARFEINVRSGQISVTEGTVLNASTDTAIDDGNNEASYVVTVTAKDPSGAMDTVEVTINVGNVDEAPTGLDADANPTKLTIDENGRELSAPADSDLTYTAADPDGGGVALEWDLSGADAASFVISDSGGVLSYNDETDDTQDDFVAPPDHEAKAEYNITIEVKGGDDSTAKSTLDVTVTVDDVAEDGTVMLSARQSHVGKSVTAELDEDDDNATGIQWRWTTVASDGGCANADFGDIAPSSSYTPVLADDEQYLCAQASYFDDAEPADAETRDTSVGESEAVIEVRPTSNSAPKFPDGDDEGTDADPITIEIEENDEGPIGDPVTAEDSDATPVQDLLLYSIGGPDGASFTIEERDTNSAGQISVADGVTLDFENPSDVGGTPGDNEYVVMVTATDPSGASDTVMVTITVKPVDEKPEPNTAPEFDAETAERSVDENSAAGTDVGDPIVAMNNDTGDSLTYSLDALGDMYFDIDDMGQITVGDGAMLDHETTASHMVTVTATDTGRLYAMITVTIMVTDVNEAPAFDAETGSYAFDENIDTAANNISPLPITDVDDGDTLTYELGGDDAASFVIDSATGGISFAEGTMLDYETKSSYSYTVTATDSGGLSDTIMVTITVSDVNEAPTFDALQAELMADVVELSVDENTAAGEAIGDQVIAATDVDAGDMLTYSLDAAGDMYFEFDSATGQLMTEAALDFESDTTSYSVTVTATDGGGLSDMVTVAITVTDVNDAPVFASDTEMISVDENTPVGTEIGPPITATDEDAGATLEYSLGGDDAESFEIDAASGQLKTVDELDYETKSSYTVTVMASDGELYAEITVTVAVSVDNVNEAPVFDEGDSADRNVDENTEAGMAFGDPITATDVDAGDTLTYSLDATGDMSFDIDSATGQLMTEAALDFEMTTSYDVTVMATDSDGLYDTIGVTIMVNDVGESQPPVFDAETATFMVYENMDVGSAVGTVTATDGVSYSDDSDYFDVDDMGNITTAMMLDYESATSHTVTVTATSVTDETDSIAVTVNVGDVEECEDAGATAVADRTNVGAMSDCEALLASRDALMGDDATRMLNWSADTPIAEWDGVRKLSDSGRVEWLYLHGVSAKDATDDADAKEEKKLYGTIPAELGGLTEMTRLYLHRNNLSGAIPSELNGLTNLVWLRLYDNMLSGEVPDLTGMTSLERFYVHQNDLTGGVPTELSNSVTHILVHRNMLTGEIPDLSGMTNLVWLSLYDNDLSGEIPGEVGSIADLEVLYLHGNDLTGMVPAELAALSNLRSLWLKNNDLSGALPGELDNLTNLTLVRISGNAFTGCVPEGLTDAEGRSSDAAELSLPTCGEPGQ